MPSYKCELQGLCGVNIQVAVWNDRFILTCERGAFSERTQGKIVIPYVKQVRARCEECPHKDTLVEIRASSERK
jgi:hypothetical protein